MYALDLNPSILTEDARVRLFRPLHAVHVGRHRHAGEMDPREPQRQSRHPRRRHVPRQRSLGRRRASAGRDADLPGVLGGRAVLLGDQLPASVRHRRHHAAAASARRPRSRYDEGILHPAGEDHRERRDPPRHRGALSARLAQARAGGARLPRPDGRQHHRPRPRPGADPRYGAGGGQGRDEAHPRQRRGGVPRQAARACPTASGATAPMSNAAGPATAAPTASRSPCARRATGSSSRTKAPRRSTAR